MSKYRLYAKVVGSKYLGEIEAESEAEAADKGYMLDAASICLCHHCAPNCEDPEVDDITAELINENNQSES